MKSYLGAPIEFDGNAGGFLYKRASGEETYQLPGLWFSAAELQCLAVLQRLLSDLGGGFLGEQVGAIGRRLNQLVSHRRLNLGEAAARLRFPSIAARSAGEAFQVAASATLGRKKLWFHYHARGSNRISERTVSPQRLVHYRDAWYLDAWDESSHELRTFSTDRMRQPKVLSESAHNIPEHELNEHFGSGYGIFGGKADKTAVLRFSNERARWVAEEEWHPAQKGALQGCPGTHNGYLAARCACESDRTRIVGVGGEGTVGRWVETVFNIIGSSRGRSRECHVLRLL
jgi:predicted DNA-binding transcriptional regulator YafY